MNGLGVGIGMPPLINTPACSCVHIRTPVSTHVVMLVYMIVSMHACIRVCMHSCIHTFNKI